MAETRFETFTPKEEKVILHYHRANGPQFTLSSITFNREFWYLFGSTRAEGCQEYDTFQEAVTAFFKKCRADMDQAIEEALAGKQP